MNSITVRSNGKVLKVAVNASGEVDRGTLRAAFLLEDGTPISLREEGTCMILSGDVFVLGQDWKDKIFDLEWDEVRRSRPSTPNIDRPPNPMQVEKTNRIKRILTNWEHRVFRIFGDKLIDSSVLINKKHILTAAHLSFKLNKMYKIEGTQKRTFYVQCQFICQRFDFAILYSEDLLNSDLHTENLLRGHTFFMMGYPNGVDVSHPTITKGIIEGTMDDLVHLVGTPDSKRGYSGAPVFNESGSLAGLLLGDTKELSVNTTIKECLEAAAEQKYARILEIKFCVFRYGEGNSDSES